MFAEHENTGKERSIYTDDSETTKQQQSLAGNIYKSIILCWSPFSIIWTLHIDSFPCAAPFILRRNSVKQCN